MDRRTLLGLLAAAPACATCASLRAAAQGAHWSYEGEAGPDKWGALGDANKSCSIGTQQSPIDIKSAVRAAMPPIEVGYNPLGGTVVNNGHTIQVNTEGTHPLKIGADRFNLQQFHFHAPSEHLIDGRRSAMELHFVHAATGRPGFAVLGVLLEPGAPNRAFQAIMAALPRTAGSSMVLPAPVATAALRPGALSYYRYEGSLTTPPCSEQVTWLVARDTVRVAQEDIARFTALYAANARPVQAINRRFLLRSR